MPEALITNTVQTDPQILIDSFFEIYDEYTDEDKTKISAAWNFLYEKTKNLKRNCGKPYYLHPMRVACILAEKKMDADSIISGFFHNVLETGNITEEELRTTLGEDILTIVNGTRRITSLKIKNLSIQQADAIRKMLFAMSEDARIIMIKLADRLDRMRNLDFVDKKSQKEIAAEVLDIWCPLAARLGMSSVKNELEDLYLKYTNPQVFRQIKDIVAQKKDERNEYLDKSVQKIYKATQRTGMIVSISSRAKHFYSIYQKMRKRNKSAGELYDLLALRIICNTEQECYTLIGIVHSLWKPMDGLFKDYIAMPKANGYQSLHTTVMCDGRPLEIQIRTKHMHDVAEHGVASHWLYKKGTNHDLVSIEKLSLFNELKKLGTEKYSDPQLFQEIKNDILGDEIYVFTPKGDVIKLPAGSTAIDFAYHIHSVIGEKIVGAKADGKIIPLSTPLQNTQLIDIITNPQAHPTENQLSIAHSSKAKQKIRAWLTANLPSFTEKNNTQKAPAENSGTAQPVPKKVNEHKKSASGEKKEAGKIKIGNSTNFVVTFAKCCNPKPGDPIVGYVSRNRGLTIHRADCLTFQRIPNIEQRTIDVLWDTEDIKGKDKKKH